jgi:hypothetical protein|tara:strand:- start:1473 stop:1646 length:174 start_codon:yes stop_codon:yes gene_type:complete
MNKMNWKKIGLGASLASIIGSIAIYATYDTDLGIFVGLWASALLLLTDRVEEVMGNA